MRTGQIADRDRVDGSHLTYLDRSSVFNAVVEPERTSALIGAIVLEDLDLIVDCTTQQLVPRDPKRIILRDRVNAPRLSKSKARRLRSGP